MSSLRRRPFGNPARSPPSTPSVEHVDVHGAIDMFRRSCSLGVTFAGMFRLVDPGQEHLDQVGPLDPGRVRVRVRDRRVVHRVQQVRQLRVLHERQGRAVGRGLGGVEVVLQPHRDRRPRSRAACRDGRPARTCPRPSATRRRTGSAVLLRDVVLQMPTIGFASASLLRARSVFGTCRANVFTLKPASVSSPTSVRFAPYSRSNTRRSRKNASSDWPAQRLARRGAELDRGGVEQIAVVVRHRGAADVGRRRDRVVHERLLLALVPVDPDQVVGLVEVQIRVVQRRDRAGVVQERVRVAVVVAKTHR